jgi:hypothetical protein
MRRCHAIVSSVEPGFNGLLSGLSLLASAGEIEYSESVARPARLLVDQPWHLRSRDYAAMKIIIDDRIRCHIDVHDSWEIDLAAYENSDVYFKRSHDPGRLPPTDFPRLRPLGLVHDVRNDGLDLRELRRIARLEAPGSARVGTLLKTTLASVASAFNRGPRPNRSLLQADPDPTLEPRVLFMVGLWDPSDVPADRQDKVAEFEAINEMRVACIRSLRREFGHRFTGGVMHTDFARRRYPDVLLDDPRAALKRSYIRRVRQHPICVATTGLHGSNGWKLAEYVALSRAIVAEPLRYAIPGEFAAPSHYLGFRSADECTGQVHRLMADPTLRHAQMRANQHYYQHHMRPEALARYVIDVSSAH